MNVLFKSLAVMRLKGKVAAMSVHGPDGAPIALWVEKKFIAMGDGWFKFLVLCLENDHIETTIYAGDDPKPISDLLGAASVILPRFGRNFRMFDDKEHLEPIGVVDLGQEPNVG